MLKRKYGNRSEWKRVLKRKYVQTYLDTGEFKGYITLLNIKKVTEPLIVSYEDKDVCIVDDDYMWLQQFPLNKRHSVTTMFDANDNIVQWYIDICLENGLDGGIPWMDDLFLDIVLLPSGEMIQKDADELEEAFSNGVIDKYLNDLAWGEAKHSCEIYVVKRRNFLNFILLLVIQTVLKKEDNICLEKSILNYSCLSFILIFQMKCCISESTIVNAVHLYLGMRLILKRCY